MTEDSANPDQAEEQTQQDPGDEKVTLDDLKRLKDEIELERKAFDEERQKWLSERDSFESQMREFYLTQMNLSEEQYNALKEKPLNFIKEMYNLRGMGRGLPRKPNQPSKEDLTKGQPSDNESKLIGYFDHRKGKWV